MKKLFSLLLVIVPFSANAEEVSPAAVADLSARITMIEEQNRQLTGRIEELEYQLKQQEAMIKTTASQAQIQEQPVEPTTQPDNPYVTRVGDENPEYVKKAPPEPESSAMEDDFDMAFINIATEDYKKAKPELTNFIGKYPKTDLAGEAYFWLGEVAWAEKDHATAAINYLKGYKESPTGNKAPENILKLALTLKELGKIDEACKNLQRFDTEFPDAHISLRSKAQSGRSDLGCK